MTAVASEKRETTNITIKAEDVDDSAAFITEAYNISSRFEPNQSTLASAVWSVANWNYIDVPMSDLSSNIGNVIEEQKPRFLVVLTMLLKMKHRVSLIQSMKG